MPESTSELQHPVPISPQIPPVSTNLRSLVPVSVKSFATVRLTFLKSTLYVVSNLFHAILISSTTITEAREQKKIDQLSNPPLATDIETYPDPKTISQKATCASKPISRPEGVQPAANSR